MRSSRLPAGFSIGALTLAGAGVFACQGPAVPTQERTAGASGASSGAGGGAGQGGEAGNAVSAVGGAGTNAGAAGTNAGAAGTNAGAAGTNAGAAGTTAGAAGTEAGAAGTSAGAAGASAGAAGTSAGTAGTSAGAAGSAPLPVVDAACDFTLAGDDCVKCGGTECVDTNADPANCGACGNVCKAGEACRNGSCGATIIGGGGSYTPGILQSGKVYGWGYNAYLGLGSQPQGNTPIVSPIEVPGLGTDLRVAIASDISCAADATGAVRCIGLNWSGQLGIGTLGGPDGCGVDEKPRLVCHGTAEQAKITDVTELRSGQYWSGGTHVCARRADRSIHCWGDLSKSGGVVTTTPVKVAGVPPSAGLALTYTANCSRACNGSVVCWGTNNLRQLGRETPNDVAGPGAIPNVRLTSFAGGTNHFCGIDEQRRLVCWGSSAHGQSGPGQAVYPQIIAGVTDVVQVAVGDFHTCARTAAGEVFCFGERVAAGNPGPRPAGCTSERCDVPAKVAIDGVVEMAGGAAVVLARRSNGEFWAWGSTAAQMGNGLYKEYDVAKQPEKVLPLP